MDPTGSRPGSMLVEALQLPTPPDGSLVTALFLSNLHCRSCVLAVENALRELAGHSGAAISAQDVSMETHSVTVTHGPELPVSALVDALAAQAFDVHSAFQVDSADHTTRLVYSKEPETASPLSASFDQAVRWWESRRQSTARPAPEQHQPDHDASKDRASLYSADTTLDNLWKNHQQLCDDCSLGETLRPSTDKTSLRSEPGPARPGRRFEAVFAVSGMSCASCAGSITSVIEQLPFVHATSVSLVEHTATVLFSGPRAAGIVAAIKDAGFDAHQLQLKAIEPEHTAEKDAAATELWLATLTVNGMSCTSCVVPVQQALERLECVIKAEVNLVHSSAHVYFSGRENMPLLAEAVQQAGYESELASVELQSSPDTQPRTVYVRFPQPATDELADAAQAELDRTIGNVKVSVAADIGLTPPVLQIEYQPQQPNRTIRQVLSVLSSHPTFSSPEIVQPPSLEDRTRALRRRERRNTLIQLLVALVAAVPVFIITIVFEMILPYSHRLHQYASKPVWAGSVSRSAWVSFILATPVFFFSAYPFHKKTVLELRALWRPSSPTPVLWRFIRFGSMNMLLCLATTVSYFASIAELGIAATTPLPPGHQGAAMGMGGRMYYFDSVVFLTLFILMGRFIEAYSKTKAGDAVAQLGRLRPTDAVLADGSKVPVNELDAGDIVLVPVGSSPPFDGAVVQGATSFDESSLTGESVPVAKGLGDTVFSGTVNQQSPVQVCVGSTTNSMLDQIIRVVREGQARRAPIERVADKITVHFVPVVVLLAIATWLIWLGLGLGNVLPDSYMDSPEGGYPVWSLRFAIAVFVIACPCGIGLAAPTALFVGGGLAARHGILVKGGGEAFQSASRLDAIVFDKTGTLTAGSDPHVSDHYFTDAAAKPETARMAHALESISSHVVARAVAKFCEPLASAVDEKRAAQPTDIREIAGKGITGLFDGVEVLVGNTALMADYDILLSDHTSDRLLQWQRRGDSIALVAVKRAQAAGGPAPRFAIAAAFAVTDPIRPDAAEVVKKLQARGISVWMLSGDNPTTAASVAAQVGIADANVIAGVLPHEKAEHIGRIRTLLSAADADLEAGPAAPKKPARIGMVGDGINDSPALAAADVGIAIGSGADVAISAAEVVLLTPSLDGVVVLVDLAKKVFRRVWFNFGWAFVYNVVAMPIAAGVLYPLQTSSGAHIRLDPVWAALAMACSSISVVLSSLLLRSKIPGLGFRRG